MVLLHGLFGQGNNLGALARALRDRYQVYSVDLPNHGRSGWLDEMQLSSLTAGLVAWLDAQTLHGIRLVGHSLGGKVAMQIALDQPARVAALAVADIAPVAYPARHDTVLAALSAVEEAGCSSREEAAGIMSGFIEEEGVSQFLLMSLARGDDGRYRWRFNLEGIRRGYGAVRKAPASASPYPGPTLFIKGENSDYIQAAHRESISGLFPAAELKVMAGCGHWLHAEQPRLFNGIVGRFLDRA